MPTTIPAMAPVPRSGLLVDEGFETERVEEVADEYNTVAALFDVVVITGEAIEVADEYNTVGDLFDVVVVAGEAVDVTRDAETDAEVDA
ncbi:MAG: hypothetical protein ASARMPREDX12_003575 [Alectoria sarmentosa]|nr:MAG: hypothetical protein ASARMPREDX12_003575 [Alectoria sarmentosa]